VPDAAIARRKEGTLMCWDRAREVTYHDLVIVRLGSVGDGIRRMVGIA